MKVLVIDDDADIRTAVRLGFEIAEGDHEVQEAGDREEALACLRRARPEVVLLDVVLGETSGVAFFEELRGSAGGADLPVLFLTATSDEARLAELEALSGSAVLPKPFDPLALPGQVEAALGLTEPDGSRGGGGAAPVP